MYQRVFATVSDSLFFPGLWILLNSVYVYHKDELRFFIFDNGLSKEEKEAIKSHNVKCEIIEKTRLNKAPFGGWEMKQLVYSHLFGKARNVLLIDSDAFLVSNLNDMFELSEKGLIVGSEDGDGGLSFDKEYENYGNNVVGKKIKNFCVCVMCMDTVKHWDLIAEWSFAANYGLYSPNKGVPLGLKGHGDQYILNPLLCKLKREDEICYLPWKEWNNAGWHRDKRYPKIQVKNNDGTLVVLNGETNNRQRILHGFGPTKVWHEEGYKNAQGCGDFLNCLHHFWDFPQKYPFEKLNFIKKQKEKEPLIKKANILSKIGCSFKKCGNSIIEYTTQEEMPNKFNFIGEEEGQFNIYDTESTKCYIGNGNNNKFSGFLNLNPDLKICINYTVTEDIVRKLNFLRSFLNKDTWKQTAKNEYEFINNLSYINNKAFYKLDDITEDNLRMAMKSISEWSILWGDSYSKEKRKIINKFVIENDLIFNFHIDNYRENYWLIIK